MSDLSLRARFTEALKASMRAGDAPRTSTIRMIIAKMKEADIAARPAGIEAVPDDQLVPMLRGMAKSRRESVELYVRGNRPELAAKEEAEIAVIEGFLPRQMDADATAAAIRAAIAEAGAAGPKDMGKVMAVLRAKHGGAMDLGRAGPLVKAALAGP